MILWYDDIRRPPYNMSHGVYWARTNEAAYSFIHNNHPHITHAFLDHDMGLQDVHPDAVDKPWSLIGHAPENGLDLAKYIVAMNVNIGIITVHSWNPEGALNIKKTLVAGGYPDVYIDPFREEWYDENFLLPALRP